jgi:hypothetical protein
MARLPGFSSSGTPGAAAFGATGTSGVLKGMSAASDASAGAVTTGISPGGGGSGTKPQAPTQFSAAQAAETLHRKIAVIKANLCDPIGIPVSSSLIHIDPHVYLIEGAEPLLGEGCRRAQFTRAQRGQRPAGLGDEPLDPPKPLAQWH